uniref:Uncharacterized protein n=1 Tax=Anguilla anguilla TaxID=7936 RepID=A0A0E9XTU8_ANGAN
MGTLMNTQTLSQPTSPSALMMSSRKSMSGSSPIRSPGLMVMSMQSSEHGPLPIALGTWRP